MDFVNSALDGVIASHSSTVALVVGALLSLWAASGFVGAFMWAADVINETKTMRPFWKDLPVRFGLALGLLALLALTAATLTLVGPVGSAIADATGIGNGPLHLWTWIKWPLLLALGLLMVGLLFRSRPRAAARPAPAARRCLDECGPLGRGDRRLRLLPDALGVLRPRVRRPATLIAFLVWAWVLNIGLLAGALVDERSAGGGGPRGAPPAARTNGRAPRR